MSDLFAKCHGDGGYFGVYRAAGDKYVVRPILDSLPGPHMESGGRRVIMWGINSYLGLTGNERIKAAAEASVARYSTCTPMGSRPAHRQYDQARGAGAAAGRILRQAGLRAVQLRLSWRDGDDLRPDRPPRTW